MMCMMLMMMMMTSWKRDENENDRKIHGKRSRSLQSVKKKLSRLSDHRQTISTERITHFASFRHMKDRVSLWNNVAMKNSRACNK